MKGGWCSCSKEYVRWNLNNNQPTDVEKITTLSDLQANLHIESDTMLIIANAELHGLSVARAGMILAHIKAIAFRISDINQFDADQRNYIANELLAKANELANSVKTNKFSGN